MQTSEFDITYWRNEQLKYFKSYLNNFEKESHEYQIILKGIKELETIVN